MGRPSVLARRQQPLRSSIPLPILCPLSVCVRPCARKHMTAYSGKRQNVPGIEIRRDLWAKSSQFEDFGVMSLSSIGIIYRHRFWMMLYLIRLEKLNQTVDHLWKKSYWVNFLPKYHWSFGIWYLVKNILIVYWEKRTKKKQHKMAPKAMWKDCINGFGWTLGESFKTIWPSPSVRVLYYLLDCQKKR